MVERAQDSYTVSFPHHRHHPSFLFALRGKFGWGKVRKGRNRRRTAGRCVKKQGVDSAVAELHALALGSSPWADRRARTFTS